MREVWNNKLSFMDHKTNSPKELKRRRLSYQYGDCPDDIRKVISLLELFSAVLCTTIVHSQ